MYLAAFARHVYVYVKVQIIAHNYLGYLIFNTQYTCRTLIIITEW